jgi:uncharacterized protein (TIGR00251 family)
MNGAPASARPVWRERADGIGVSLRVTPGAKRTAIRGVQDIGNDQAALAVSIRAPARDGKANEAVIALLAEALGVSRSKVSMQSGMASRLKSVYVAGDPAQLSQTLSALLAEQDTIADQSSYQGSSR